MICGSTEMGKDVAKKLQEILKDSDGFTFENLEQNNQIKVDTY
jgi:sulfite reductase alpha subunit-like flavoprotein